MQFQLGGGGYKILLMPFTAQLTIPFFMTITGFTYATSYEKHGGYWSIQILARKVKRILLPLIPVLILELLVIGIPENIGYWVASGGYQMPGSYYTILLLQLLLVYPAIKIAVDKTGAWWHGIIGAFIFHILYEILTYVLDLDVAIYRLLVFRYIIFLYGGALIYKHRDKLKSIKLKMLIPSLLIGVAFITVIGYVGFQPSVIFRYPTWYRSSAPVAFWVLPIMVFLMGNQDAISKRLTNAKLINKSCELIALIGKASYQVYLVQMLWFGMVIIHFDGRSWRKIIICVVSWVIAGLGGIAYYYLSERLGRSLHKKHETIW